MPKSKNDPEPDVDPNVEPDGDPTDVDPTDVNWQERAEEYQRQLDDVKKKYGDIQNELGRLRSDTAYYRTLAENQQRQPQEQPASGINLPEDSILSEGDYKALRDMITDVVEKREVRQQIQSQIDYISKNYKCSKNFAQNVLSFGYNQGLSDPDQIVEAYKRETGDLGGNFLNTPQPDNGNPPAPQPRRVADPVKRIKAPSMPEGGEPGKGAQRYVMPSIKEWESFDDKTRAMWKKRVYDGLVDVNTTGNVRIERNP